MSSLDIYVLGALFALRDPALVQFFVLVTFLGNTYTILALSACVGLVLALRKRLAYLFGLIVGVGGSAITVWVLKELVQRSRPDILYNAYPPETLYSFPSWHAAGAMMFYGFLAYLAWKQLPRSHAIAVIVFVALLIGLIGFSRLYLGLHYLSDVVGGYLIGGAFLALGIWVSERLTRHPIWS